MGQKLKGLSGLEAVYAAEMGASRLALPALVLLGLRCEHLNYLGPLGVSRPQGVREVCSRGYYGNVILHAVLSYRISTATF